MAIKELDMMNVVCQRKDLDELIKELILIEKCEFIDTFLEIDEGEFNIGISVDHADEILGMEDIEPINENKDIDESMEELNRILESIDYQPKIQRHELIQRDVFLVLREKISKMCDEFIELAEQIKEKTEKIETLNDLFYFEPLESYQLDFKELVDLKHFTMRLGYLKRERANKMYLNYENIKAIVLHMGAAQEQELYLVLSPKSIDQEMDRILRSINFHELTISKEYLGTPKEIMRQVKAAKKTNEDQLVQLKEISRKAIMENRATIDQLYSKIKMEKQMDLIRTKVAATKNFAYFSAWIPKEEKPTFEKIFSKFIDVAISYKSADEVSPHIPIPTRLQNNRFFQPFELLVNMYGIPSHNEIDPTVFFGVAYMFLFGAMFGDLGQGLMIVLGGMLLKRKIDKNFSSILIRIGLGSMAFGILYDSFFGYEGIISKFLPLPFYLRPLDNINLILALAVGAGIGLITISYGYSIVNKWKVGDLEEGLFGKNGINGLVLFFMILLLGAAMILEFENFPLVIPGSVIALNVVILVIKQPLANRIQGIEPLYEEEKGAYFIESGFNVFEVFLTLLSNLVSFVRVGAFALNHVGLFIAFHTLANMVGGIGGNIVMFIIGNLIILGLEGLIVFIQGLRLFYYELFSKYYSGEGILFVPDKI